jgi:predicted HD phosphohydrolase
MFNMLAPRNFEDFERRITTACKAAPHPPLSQRAASLARQAGACDVIVTAALVHDYAGSVAAVHADDHIVLSAVILRNVFEEAIYKLLLEFHDLQMMASSQPEAIENSQRQAARLARYVCAAGLPESPSLSLQHLLTVARRMSRDDY